MRGRERKGKGLRPPFGPEDRVESRTDEDLEFVCTANRGDRIELLDPSLGVHVRGTVFYADQLQLLVKWDDGRSESMRRGTRLFRVLPSEPDAAVA
jgi:hypothetical protein